MDDYLRHNNEQYDSWIIYIWSFHIWFRIETVSIFSLFLKTDGILSYCWMFSSEVSLKVDYDIEIAKLK